MTTREEYVEHYREEMLGKEREVKMKLLGSADMDIYVTTDGPVTYVVRYPDGIVWAYRHDGEVTSLLDVPEDVHEISAGNIPEWVRANIRDYVAAFPSRRSIEVRAWRSRPKKRKRGAKEVKSIRG